jgi:thiol:disulfide interchange protein DsbC
MRLCALLATLTLAMLAAVPGHAQSASEQQMKAELKKHLPEATIDTVRKVPYGNLYEVVANGEIFYTDEKSSYLLMGPIIDLKTRENVTDARLRQVNAVKFDALNFANAIKIVRGNGSRKLAIFEDPNCGYCKRFERDLLGISDVTVYVFLYPILSPDSVDKARGVWCSADRGKAWLDIMTRDAAAPAAGTCNTPLDENLAFGREKKITGTPTIIFENGERIPGAMPAAEIEKRLVAARSTPAPSVSAR